MIDNKVVVSNTNQFQEGNGVWVPDAELEWISAEVLQHDEGSDVVLVRTEDDRELKIPVGKVFYKNPDILEGVDDLSSLSHLHEAAILHNLHHRYNYNQIYTYIGKILIAINPYTSLPIFGKEMISAYYGKSLGMLSPHVYAVAEDSFRDMRIDGVSQSILVSGESGAGKTETTKFLLQYFAAMGNMIKENGGSSNTVPSSPHKKGVPHQVEKSVEERVLESTPLLEAFGNAKTLRNDNSSRFGKFIEIHFNEYGSIIGAKILTYLLEKSRIVRQVYNERNYHIFYQLIAGADSELQEKLNLLDINDYSYLNQSGCIDIPGVSDEEHFKKTCHAMQVAGISVAEQENVFKCLSAILLLGNLVFEDQGNDNSKLVDHEPLEIASKLLGCPTSDLLNTLLTRKVVTGKDVFITNNTKERAENARDSLSMFLYGMVFDWLVVKINSSMSIVQKSKSFIGVLDIYGFESFEVNGFEQFCINYANEKLQQLFNQHVFKEEQQEYIKEKIDWSYIDFNDNQDTLDLIEKKPICILSLLDEETMFPKATAQTLATKLYSKLTGQAKFERPRFSNTAFTINHYAGKVTYETDQFLDKNKDFIIPEQISILQKSEFAFIGVLLSHSGKFSSGGPAGPAGPSNKPNSSSNSSSMKFLSVGSQFSTSLATLMKTISTTNPHYIRCIKPNPDKLPQTFNKHDVIHQLRCGGVMESVRICCAGFPTRRPLPEFYARYKILNPKQQIEQKRQKIKDPKVLVQNLLEGIHLSEDKYKIGITKVFLRAGQLAALEDMRNEQLNHSATMIQKNWRRFFYFKQFQIQRKAALVIQTKIRSQAAKQLFATLQKQHAATFIQKIYRGYMQRTKYQKTREAAIALQTSIRRSMESHLVHTLRTETAAITMQTVIRATMAKAELEKRIRIIVKLQSKWRGKLARKDYIQLRAEARSLRTVQAEKNKLQEKLDEMQWRLTSESKRRQQLEEAKTKTDKQLEETESSKEHLLLSLSELESKFQQLESSNSAIVVQYDSAKEQLELVNTQYDQSSKLNKKLEKDVSDLGEKSALLEKQLEEIQSVKSQLDLQVGQLETQTKDQQISIDAKQREIELIQSDREKENYQNLQEFQALKKQQQSLEEDFTSLSGIRDSLERSMAELTEELSQTKEKLGKYQSDSETSYHELMDIKADLEKQLFQSKENSLTLEARIDQMEAFHLQESNQWKSSEQSFKEQINQLVNQSDDLKTKLAARDTTIQEITEKAKKLKSKYSSLDEEKKSIASELEKLRISKHMADEEKSQLSNQLQNAKLESNQQSTSTIHLKEKISLLKKNIESLNSEVNKMSSDLRIRDEQLSKSTIEIQDLRSQSVKQAKDFVELESNLQLEKSKNEILVLSLKKTNESLGIELEKYQTSLKQTERDLIQVKDNVSKLEIENKQLSALKERFESEFFVAKEQNSSSAQESVYLKEVTSQMQQTQARLEKELDEKKQTLAKTEDEKELLQKQVQQLTLSNEQTTTQLNAALVEFEKLKKKEEKLKNKNIDSVKQCELVTKELQDLKIANNDACRTNTEFDNDRKKLREKLAALKSTIQTLRESIVKMETEVTLTKQHNQFVESTFTDMRARNEELKESTVAFKNQIGVLQVEIENTNSAKAKEIKQLEQLLENEQSNREGALGQVQQQLQKVTEENANLCTNLQQAMIDNKKLEDSSIEIANQLMETKLENERLKQSIKEQENNSKRMSVEIQQQLQDTKQQEQLNNKIEQLENDKKLWQDERVLLVKGMDTLKSQNQMVLDQAKNKEAEVMYKYQELSAEVKSFKNLMDIIDYRENEWERLARFAGSSELETKYLSDYLLVCKLEQTSLAAHMWFHQLDYWKSFERQGHNDIFRGIIGSAVDFTRANFEDVELLSYLLGSSSLLFFLYYKRFKPFAKTSILATDIIVPTTPTITDIESLDEKVDSINSSIDFLEELNRTIGRTYGQLYKLVTTKLGSLLDGAILNENYKKKPTTSIISNAFGRVDASQGSPVMDLAQITNFLFSMISIFQHRMIHFTFSQQFFNQVFCWIGAQIFKGFMLRQAFCKESFAQFVKQRVDGLVHWANETGEMWVGRVDNAFSQVKEVINILTQKDKEKLADEKVRKVVCPTLNPSQIQQVLIMYTPDSEFGTKIPMKVINQIGSKTKTPTTSTLSYLIDERLNNIPVSSLHYLEIEDVKNPSISASIKGAIETEIKNIKKRIISNK
ncbi:hypothetical protein CYY_000168 [Polysphondylium violaceum]|uniref:Uncharacterized protein n=1 Tax=Polysphondylium violaceum TaxID=133409 RepID=A0A8J4Q478_9MYCE|nr:hypothetical protein CYY_000168 [Polysphondylium violaceum]